MTERYDRKRPSINRPLPVHAPSEMRPNLLDGSIQLESRMLDEAGCDPYGYWKCKNAAALQPRFSYLLTYDDPLRSVKVLYFSIAASAKHGSNFVIRCMRQNFIDQTIISCIFSPHVNITICVLPYLLNWLTCVVT